MVLRTTSPFESLLKLQQALTNMGNTSPWLGGSISSGGSFPSINVFQDKNDYVLVAEIPGIKRDDVSIEIHRNKVRLSGEKRIDYGNNVSLHRRERVDGKFDRTISIPFEIEASKVKAEYQDGILAVFLPRAEHEKPRTIKLS